MVNKTKQFSSLNALILDYYFFTAIVEKMSVKTKEQADELIAEKIRKKKQLSEKIVSK